MKNAILAHVEKPILAICVGLMAMFLWNAVSLKRYEKTPGQFQDVTDRARNNVKSAPVDLNTLEAPDLGKVVNAAVAPIASSGHQFATAWMRRFNFTESFRNQPKLLKPENLQVQSNRGLIGMFKTDLQTGKRIVRKVKAKDAEKRFLVSSSADPSQRMRGFFESQGMDRSSIDQMMSGMGGMSSAMEGMESDMVPDEGMGMMGMGMGMSSAYGGMAGGMGGMNSSAMTAMYGSMMRGSGSMQQMMSMGMSDPSMMYGMGDMSGMTMMPQPKVSPGVSDRIRRFIVPREALGKAAKDKKDEKKKEEELVEEYVEAFIGRHWVEIVATFPHADQIREYVKALREPAQFVGLRYVLAEVRRAELLRSLEWSDWRPIDLADQMGVVQNAIGFEEETYPQVFIDGLAMNIPFLQTTEKPFLHETLEQVTKPQMAQYTPEEMNPKAFIAQKIESGRRSRRFAKPLVTTKPQPGAAKKAEPPHLAKQRGVRKLEVKTAQDIAKELAGKDAKKVMFNNNHAVKEAVIRFWDFTVVPGRRYKYQIRVQVFNPNYNRADVAEARFATPVHLAGPWSEETPEVYIEPDLNWYVPDQRGRSAPDRAASEVHFWSREMGEWIVSEFTHRAGEIIGTARATRANDIVRWDEEERRWKFESAVLGSKLDTDAIVLDVEGGPVRVEIGAKARNFQVPKEIVAVNIYGDLVRHSSDVDTANAYRKAIADGYRELIEEMKKSTTPKPALAPGGAAGAFEP